MPIAFFPVVCLPACRSAVCVHSRRPQTAEVGASERALENETAIIRLGGNKFYFSFIPSVAPSRERPLEAVVFSTAAAVFGGSMVSCDSTLSLSLSPPAPPQTSLIQSRGHPQ